jgi:hypothetical protein
MSAAPPPAHPDLIPALGHLAPQGGVIRLSGPSDRVKKRRLLANLDILPVIQAEVQRLEAELEPHGASSSADSRSIATPSSPTLSATNGSCGSRVADVFSPVDGQILKVHALEGEHVGLDGIVEFGKTDHMFAIPMVDQCPGLHSCGLDT